MQQPKPISKKVTKKPVVSEKPTSADSALAKKFGIIPSEIGENVEYSKRSGIPLSEIFLQGGVTPASVRKQISELKAYDVKIVPGLYKKSPKVIIKNKK